MTARRWLSAGVAGVLAAAVLAPSSVSAAGGLTQKSGSAGCVSGGGGPCASAGTTMGLAESSAVSPDGKHLYVPSNQGVTSFSRAADGGLTPIATLSDPQVGGGGDVEVSQDGANVYVTGTSAIVVFDRNPSTGALTRKPGPSGCTSNTAQANCVDGRALDNTTAVEVSPNGAQVYVASGNSGGIAVFDRDSAGVLTQKVGSAGCITQTGSGADTCLLGVALAGATDVVTSSNGAHVYVTSFTNDAVVVLDRDTSTGALSPKAGTNACASKTGNGGACSVAPALENSGSVALSSDGLNAYVGGTDRVVVLDRSTSTGALTQKPGPAGCVSDTGNGGLCGNGNALGGNTGVAVSTDGSNVYVTASTGDAIAIFDRVPSTGALSQPAGVSGCISDTGSGGTCRDGAGLENPSSATLSPDGKSLYTVGILVDGFTFPGTVGVFDRGGTPGGDTTPPMTTIDKKPKRKVFSAKSKVKVKVIFSSEPGATFTCKVDKGAFTACTSPFKAKVRTAPGKGKKHKILVVAKDAAGNIDPTPAKASFKAVRRPKT